MYRGHTRRERRQRQKQRTAWERGNVGAFQNSVRSARGAIPLSCSATGMPFTLFTMIGLAGVGRTEHSHSMHAVVTVRTARFRSRHLIEGLCGTGPRSLTANAGKQYESAGVFARCASLEWRKRACLSEPAERIHQVDRGPVWLCSSDARASARRPRSLRARIWSCNDRRQHLEAAEALQDCLPTIFAPAATRTPRPCDMGAAESFPHPRSSSP